jgi:hypothetical protein
MTQSAPSCTSGLQEWPTSMRTRIFLPYSQLLMSTAQRLPSTSRGQCRQLKEQSLQWRSWIRPSRTTFTLKTLPLFVSKQLTRAATISTSLERLLQTSSIRKPSTLMLTVILIPRSSLLTRMVPLPEAW